MTTKLDRVNQIIQNFPIQAQYLFQTNTQIHLYLTPTPFPKLKPIIEENPQIFSSLKNFCQNCGSTAFIKCEICGQGWCTKKCREQNCFKHFVICGHEKGLADCVFLMLETCFQVFVTSKSVNKAIIAALELFGTFGVLNSTEKSYAKLREKLADFEHLFTKFQPDYYIEANLDKLKAVLLSDAVLSFVENVYNQKKIPIFNNCLQHVGDGLYQVGSLIGHSCRPTAAIQFVGVKAQIYRLVDSGELSLDFKVRGDLASQGIVCKCEDCQQ